MSRKQKTPKESYTTMTELVLPNDTNHLTSLMGGRMMHWMDIVSFMAAQKHANCTVVTASADNISFKYPIQLGDVVTLEAKVTRTFNSSMEIYVEVFAENISSDTKFKSHSAFFTFVAIDQAGNPTDVPELIPETAEEQKLHIGALRRRQLRLVLAKRIKLEEATELKSIFDI